MVSKTEHSLVCVGGSWLLLLLSWSYFGKVVNFLADLVYLISIIFTFALGTHSGIIHTSGFLRKLPAYCVTRGIFQHMLIKWIFLALCKNSRCPCRDGTWCRRLSQPFLETPRCCLQQHGPVSSWSSTELGLCAMNEWWNLTGLFGNIPNSGHTSELSLLSLYIRLYI